MCGHCRCEESEPSTQILVRAFVVYMKAIVTTIAFLCCNVSNLQRPRPSIEAPKSKSSNSGHVIAYPNPKHTTNPPNQTKLLVGS
jgi:S-methylmethionine-dependent homocysteine/selenocysteine methylase